MPRTWTGGFKLPNTIFNLSELFQIKLTFSFHYIQRQENDRVDKKLAEYYLNIFK